jgi:hypothetical protein
VKNAQPVFLWLGQMIFSFCKGHHVLRNLAAITYAMLRNATQRRVRVHSISVIRSHEYVCDKNHMYSTSKCTQTRQPKTTNPNLTYLIEGICHRVSPDQGTYEQKKFRQRGRGSWVSPKAPHYTEHRNPYTHDAQQPIHTMHTRPRKRNINCDLTSSQKPPS